MKTDSVPFVYTLTFLDPNTKTKKWYIGVKYGKNSHPSDLWSSYFTSSKIVQQLLEAYGPLSFTTKICKCFKNERDAREYEERFIRRAISLGLRLNVQLLNKGIPNKNFANSMKGRKFEEIFDSETCARLKHILRQPKTNITKTKMVETRRKNQSYYTGEKHAMAKQYTVTSPTNEIYQLNGNLKRFCTEYNLSWQTLYSHINKGPIELDRTRHRNITRLSDRFWNTIGWEIISDLQ